MAKYLLLVAPVLLFSIIAHEYAHGYAALKQGDMTAYKLGRLTWNPIKHIDPWMSIVLPLMLYFAHLPPLAGAKPVPINPSNYRNYRRGDIIVSLAGIAANIAIAIACTIAVAIIGLLGRLVPAVSGVCTRWLACAQVPAAPGVGATIPTDRVRRIAGRLGPPELDAGHLVLAAARIRLRGAAAGRRAKPGTTADAALAPPRDAVNVATHLADVADSRDGRERASPRPPNDAPPASFVVELAHFSGPLDLLLTLLREEQIDIYDIPIARIAEQFLLRIRTLRLDEAAEYLEMAARLLRIKAQMLLPRREGAEAWDDPRAELVRRLLEYQQVREVVDVLEFRAEGRRNRFARTPLPAPARPSSSGPVSAAMADLLAAVDRLLRACRGPDVHSIVPRALDVAGALIAARALLARRAQIRWRDLVRPSAEPWEILSVLLAVLELARLGECVLRQSIPFGAVDIVGLDAGLGTLDETTDSVTPAMSSLDSPTRYDTAGAAA